MFCHYKNFTTLSVCKLWAFTRCLSHFSKFVPFTYRSWLSFYGLLSDTDIAEFATYYAALIGYFMSYEIILKLSTLMQMNWHHRAAWAKRPTDKAVHLLNIQTQFHFILLLQLLILKQTVNYNLWYQHIKKRKIIFLDCLWRGKLFFV